MTEKSKAKKYDRVDYLIENLEVNNDDTLNNSRFALANLISKRAKDIAVFLDTSKANRLDICPPLVSADDWDYTSSPTDIASKEVLNDSISLHAAPAVEPTIQLDEVPAR